MDLLGSTKMPASIDALPDEVLQHIISFLSPRDVLFNVQRTSKRWNELAGEPLLWRYHCRTEFRYWDAKHHIRTQFAADVGDVDWKRLYTQRRLVDSETTKLLDGIIGTQLKRIPKYEKISELGYDVKDTLLRHYRTAPEAEDHLARRYYAKAVLDHVHRNEALAIWHQVLSNSEEGSGTTSLHPSNDLSLEKALGAFDLFVIHDHRGDLVEISDMLDDLVVRLRLECPTIEDMPTRKRALAIVSFLRKHNLTGLASEAVYRDLQNNYIGIALQDEDHPSLPLISVAIFCAIGRRLGLDAHICGIPAHVHGMVFAAPGESLDGSVLDDTQPRADPMYLDPFRTEMEISIQDIRTMLTQWGIQQDQMAEYMRDISVPNVILRTSRNILATVHDYNAVLRTVNTLTGPSISLYHTADVNQYAELDNSFYSTLWANLLFNNPQHILHGASQTQFIQILLEQCEHIFPMDASLIESHILPLMGSGDHPAHDHLVETLHRVRLADQTPKQVHLRQDTSHRVLYKVGQVFRHKRYGYTAAIVGWDFECNMPHEWISRNDVDSLSRGRHQSFYHALSLAVERDSMRYVAEENIEIVKSDIPMSVRILAGQYFKRWDKENHVFVSNIKDEYPED